MTSARPGPRRTCIGCRAAASPAELIRVVAVDGHARVDELRRLPGRGAWLHPSPDCLAQADRRRAWARALRLSAPPDVSAVQEWVRSRV